MTLYSIFKTASMRVLAAVSLSALLFTSTAQAETDTEPRWDIWEYNGLARTAGIDKAPDTYKSIDGYTKIDTISSAVLKEGMSYTFKDSVGATYSDYGIMAVPEGTDVKGLGKFDADLHRTGLEDKGICPSPIVPDPRIWAAGQSSITIKGNPKQGCGCPTPQGGPSGNPGPPDVDNPMDGWTPSSTPTPGSSSAGSIRFSAQEPSPDLARSFRLKYTNGSDNVEVVPSSPSIENPLRQVKTGLILANVTTVNPQKFVISYYPPAQVGANKDTAGNYTFNGLPSVKVTTETLDAAGTILRVTSDRAGALKIMQYQWEPAHNAWSFSEGVDSATGVPLKKTLHTEATLPNGDLVKTELISDGAGATLSKVKRTFRKLIKGKTTRWLEIESVVDPDGAALTSTSTYAEEFVPPKLRRSVSAEGGWSTYEYHPTTERLIKRVDGFQNAPVESADGLNRVTTYAYEPVAPEDDGSFSSATARTEVVTLLGQEVSRTYRVLTDFTETEIVTTVPGAAWNAATNLVTQTTEYTGWPADNYDHYIKSVVHPDGSLETYSYTRSGSSLTTTHCRGQADASGTTVIDGTKTITKTDRGRGLTISTSVSDIASGVLLSSEIHSGWDERNRPMLTTYLDGTTNVKSYGCCGVDSETDREGVTTSSVDDEFGRRISDSRDGITTLYTLDGLGRTLRTERRGSDNSSITQQSQIYDGAGRVISSTTPAGTTTYSTILNANGHTETTTHADGGTEIRKFARDGSLMEVGGTAVPPMKMEAGVGPDGSYIKQISIGEAAAETEWVQTWTDCAGRSFKTLYAEGASSQNFFNNKGQLSKTLDPDGVVTLFAYNGKGVQEVTALDINRNGIIDFNGPDRITKQTRSIASAYETTVERSTALVWDDGSTSGTLSSMSESSLDGLRSWQTSAAGLVSSSFKVRAGDGAATLTASNPDESYSVTQTQNGRVISTSRHDGQGLKLSRVTSSYDAHNRLSESLEENVGATTFTYTDADLPRTMTLPAAAPGDARPVTTFAYDNMGRKTHATKPEGDTVTEYFPTGAVKKVSGLQTYTVQYTYTPQGRMKTLTTGTGAARGTAVTTWNYHPQRGFLTSKTYHDGKGTSYGYSAAGRMLTRTWARGVTTTYGFNSAGEPQSITYSDATPAVSFAYDRRGRQSSMTDAAGGRQILYGLDNQPLSETYSGPGLLDSITLTRSYDSQRRLASRSVNAGPTALAAFNYSYDNASRLKVVSNSDNSVTYGYSDALGVISSIQYGQVVNTAFSHDNRRRLKNTTTSTPSALVARSNYNYNALDQRTRHEELDGSAWSYGYDSLGQILSGKKKWPDGSFVPGQQYEFEWDPIGNRLKTRQGGNAAGNGLREATYTSNTLNQYTQRSVPGKLDLLGTASPATIVTVNNEPVTRQNDFFRKEVTLNNSAGPVWATEKVTAVLPGGGPGGTDVVSSQTRELSLPKTPEVFSHDPDGNLTQDGKWNYSWDGENRLIAMESIAAVPASHKTKLAFAYDGLSRRVRKKVETWNSVTGAYQPGYERRYLYDGWLTLAETDAAFNPIRSYCWGSDLSGSFEGAGGVGGLLWIKDTATAYNVSYDGNGNVVKLTNTTNGTIAASYEYGPFGEPLRASGPMADSNPFRFSTKYTDVETGLLYYGYRYYDASNGRWPSRDPLEEEGGVNLYAFIRNSSIMRIDRDGRYGWQFTGPWDHDYYEPNIPGPDWRDCVVVLEAISDFLIWLDPPPPPGVTACSVPCPLGKGGLLIKAAIRVKAMTLAEQVALQEAKAGRAANRIMKGKINDPAYPEDLWAKMEYTKQCHNGESIVIHYWQSLKDFAVRHGFKFKNE
jgi:RHS repeat-associated protein